VEAELIDAVLLTHAHIDHSGYLPLLRLQGFKGTVHASPATKDLCGLLLPDSGHLQEEDAAFANRHGFSKHDPALPLYTRQDAVNCLPMIKAQAWHQTFSPAPGFKATFSMAGHILGASSILLEVAGRRILFSGDLGRPDDLLMWPPENAPQADAVLIESTYGNRSHPADDVMAELGDALQRVAARGGVAVVPVFAVGRAQAILHAIGQLKQKGDIPHGLPVFLDSPMAVSTTDLYVRHPHAHQLDAADLETLRHVAHMVETPEASKALARHHGPMVILSASGMATGGRVLHHLGLYLPDHRNHGDFDWISSRWHAGRFIARWGQHVAHPWSGCAGACRSGEPEIGLGPCRQRPVVALAQNHAASPRPGVCGAWRARCQRCIARRHRTSTGLARRGARAGQHLARLTTLAPAA
jgi:metallo-beta-lactamase family protein